MKSNGSSPESIALLIDADNAPAKKIQFLMAELAKYGVINIRRAYGNWAKSDLSKWGKVLHRHAIQPVQHFDLIQGKNASDMAMLIDAMDILYTKNVGTFCLVSSDCDFTPLVLRLRADGKQVIGVGETKAPKPFVNSCTRFLCLDEKKKAQVAPADEVAKANQLKGDTKLMNLLRGAVEATQDMEGWATFDAVSKQIRKLDAEFKPQNHGSASLVKLFSRIDHLFEVRKAENGTPSSVSLRGRKSARKPETANGHE